MMCAFFYIYIYLFIHIYIPSLYIICHEFDSDIVPLALETYGGTSEKFDKLLEKLSSNGAEFNNIPYPILLNYWKKRISTVLQIGNVSVNSEACRRLFILEQKHCNVIMIWNVLLIKRF